MESGQLKNEWRANQIKVTIGLAIITVSVIAVLAMITNGSDSKLSISPHECRPNEMYVPENGYVPDSVTAIHIAEAIWLPVYGQSIYERRPFQAELVGDTLWIVAGSTPVHTLGGVPYIEIRKEDGKVVGMGHGK